MFITEVEYAKSLIPGSSSAQYITNVYIYIYIYIYIHVYICIILLCLSFYWPIIACRQESHQVVY